MTDSSHAPRPLQASLRSLFVLVAACALGCWLLFRFRGRVPPTWSGYFIYAAVMASMATVLGLVGGIWCGRIARPIIRRHSVRAILWAIFPVSFGLCCYIVWALYRWIDQFNPAWPRAFPYPDQILDAYAGWLDARIPAASGTLKFHGEYYTVWYHLDYLTLALIFATAFLMGTLVSRTLKDGRTTAKGQMLPDAVLRHQPLRHHHEYVLQRRFFFGEADEAAVGGGDRAPAAAGGAK